MNKNKCAVCGKAINIEDFRDNISKREFVISNTCQKCQDDFFGKV